MKKVYKIFFLSIVFIFLSTFNPISFKKNLDEDNKFFQIKHIVVTNNSLIKKNEIEKKLNKIFNKNILFINSSEIEIPLKKTNFLEKIEVKKKYPDTIIVKIFETKPVAIIFKDKKKYLLDSLSNLIFFEEYENFGKLPNVYGKEADKNFLIFFDSLKKNNFPNKEIKNFYYFKIGRWDIQLKNNRTVKFPENITDELIEKSINLISRKDFEEYNIIDLRVAGKIIVE